MQSYRSYIDGNWCQGDEIWKNTNPSDTSDIIGECEFSNRRQAEDAVAAARSAFPAWSRSQLEERAKILDRIGREITDRRVELGTLLSREEGKVLSEGIGEVDRAASFVNYMAGEVFRFDGKRYASVRPGIEIETTREPIGVVLGITPWNYPLANGAWKVAAAIGYGNCVILKPSEFAPASAWAFAEIISRAGLPPGVFNLVMGTGEIGDALVNSNDVDGITFTGAVPTGQAILAKAAKRQTRVQLELGGKNPLVILDDADLEIAINCAVFGAFSQTGQRCTASSRLIVTKGIYSKFVDALLKRTEALVVGHALEKGTNMGPVSNEPQLEKDLTYIKLGQEEGAKLLCGGARVKRETAGHFLSPAIFSDAHNDMRICREEIFGPVTTVIPARDYEEAKSLANDTEFGLSSGIVTTSLKYARDFNRNSQAGMVAINLPTSGIDYHVPFGGRKLSGFGSREHAHSADEFFTENKTTYTSPGNCD